MLEHNLNHLAIIMDGNSRWAKKNILSVVNGHTKGAEVLRDVASYCISFDIKVLTVYAFSTENWNRSDAEINSLFKLFYNFLEKEKNTFIENDIFFDVIGSNENIPQNLLDKIDEVKEATKNNNKLKLIVAFNYGGRCDIVRAVKSIGDINLVSEKEISKHIDTANFGDPDVILRTGGCLRISNFLIWQSSYAELIFIDKLWPDIEKQDIENCIIEFMKRKRNFGGR